MIDRRLLVPLAIILTSLVVACSVLQSEDDAPAATTGGDAGAGMICCPAPGAPTGSTSGATSTTSTTSSSSGTSTSTSSSGGAEAGAPLDEPFKSGSRLKQRYYEASDGTKQFLAWHDTQRNEDCAFALHADGTTRCMPTERPAFANAQWWSDSNCSTNKLGWASPPPAVMPKAAVDFANGGYKVFPVTGAYSSPSFFQGSPGSCAQLQAASYPTYAFYTLGAEIPATEFVSAVQKVAP